MNYSPAWADRQLGGVASFDSNVLTAGEERGLLSVRDIPWAPETRSRILVQLDGAYDIRGAIPNPEDSQEQVPFPIGIRLRWGMGSAQLTSVWPMSIRGICLPVDGTAVDVAAVVLFDYADTENTREWRLRCSLLPGAPSLVCIPDVMNASALGLAGTRYFIPPFMTHFVAYGDGGFAAQQRSQRTGSVLVGNGANNVAQPLPIHPWAVTLQRSLGNVQTAVVYQGRL